MRINVDGLLRFVLVARDGPPFVPSRMIRVRAASRALARLARNNDDPANAPTRPTNCLRLNFIPLSNLHLHETCGHRDGADETRARSRARRSAASLRSSLVASRVRKPR